MSEQLRLEPEWPAPTCPKCGGLAHRLGQCLACGIYIEPSPARFRYRPLPQGGVTRQLRELAFMERGAYEYGSHQDRTVIEGRRSSRWKPVPLCRELEREELAFHRPIDCPAYGECLHRAGIENWRSWSCAACPTLAVAAFAVPSPAEQRSMEREREGLAWRATVAPRAEKSPGAATATGAFNPRHVQPITGGGDAQELARAA